MRSNTEDTKEKVELKRLIQQWGKNKLTEKV